MNKHDKRLTESEIAKIKELREMGLAYMEIAQEVRRSITTCWRYGRRRKKRIYY
mgnify:CR=1 FL=1